MAKQEASFWQIATLDLCLGGKSLLLLGRTFPICIVQAISQDLTVSLLRCNGWVSGP